MIKNDELKEPASEEAGANPQNPATSSPREVAERAYYYYLNAGRPDRHDLEHWFRAEQDFMLGQSRTKLHGTHTTDRPNWGM